MKVELLYFDGCPGHRKAERTLRSTLREIGIRRGFEMVAVNTDEEAERLRFPGSPTVRVDGEDLFPEGFGPRTSWHLGCRIYRTPEGPRDHPSVEMIRSSLLRGKRDRRVRDDNSGRRGWQPGEWEYHDHMNPYLMGKIAVKEDRAWDGGLLSSVGAFFANAYEKAVAALGEREGHPHPASAGADGAGAGGKSGASPEKARDEAQKEAFLSLAREKTPRVALDRVREQIETDDDLSRSCTRSAARRTRGTGTWARR
ncbi:MAG: hypothetical protein M3R38_30075 [Actinomycetota bacterium]|nr:hypothetical protein [Actinomycetota bacterium]MDP9479862.1 hypothetical protein [Actinomycetota bacterium]